MEIIITIVLIGIIATFAIPNYTKAIKKGIERDAIIQLSTIHAASEIYKTNSGKYFIGNCIGHTLINQNLKTNIIASNGLAYKYNSSTGDNFTAWAMLGGSFSVKISNGPLTSNNPCCSIGPSCPSLPNCP